MTYEEKEYFINSMRRGCDDSGEQLRAVYAI